MKFIGEIPKDAILVAMDVTGFYTSIDNMEGLEAMRGVLQENSQNQKPSVNALTLIMRLTLMLNNLVFNNATTSKNRDGDGNKGRHIAAFLWGSLKISLSINQDAIDSSDTGTLY